MAQTRHFVWLAAVLTGCGGGAANPAYLIYVRDAQGSVVAAVDDQGHKVWETHDDSFGLRLSSTGTEVPREFLDQPLDQETGFYQFHYRMYDPQSAQWLSPDPRLTEDPGACAERPQQCNPYTYAGGRPGEWIDRDGRWADPAYQINGVTYQVITIAFVGKDSASGAAMLIDAFKRSNSVQGNRPILYDVRAFDDPSQAPASYTKAMWAADPEANDRRSGYEPTTSTLEFRPDARDANHGLDVMSHEIQHAFGAPEGYDEKTMQSLPGREHDIMANFWRQTGVPQVAAHDLAAEEDAKACGDLNQNLTTPAAPGEWPFAGPPPTQ